MSGVIRGIFAVCLVLAAIVAALAGEIAAPGATTQPAALSADMGPDVVILRELEDLYEPVPFNHKGHAAMAEMSGGCTTCHHYSPSVDKDHAAGKVTGNGRRQSESAKHPACKSCHEPTRTDLKQPGLKGAYHRQCLNCHREWAHENGCSACHKAKGSGGVATAATPKDVMARMHPPKKEPETKAYKTQFTPAAGNNVLFRHKQHIDKFGIKCVTCHFDEQSCAKCHEDLESKAAPKRMVRLTRSWDEAHRKCDGCHREDRCAHCHFKTGQPAPAAFEHAMTGQTLDKDHAGLACAQCHTDHRFKESPTCGGAACHKERPAIALPADRPGAFTPRPADRKKIPTLEARILIPGSGATR